MPAYTVCQEYPGIYEVSIGDLGFHGTVEQMADCLALTMVRVQQLIAAWPDIECEYCAGFGYIENLTCGCGHCNGSGREPLPVREEEQWVRAD